MQNLRMIFVILSMIFLSGCQSRPDILIQEQKFVTFHFVEIDGKLYIDPDLSFCLKRKYQYSLDLLGPVEKFQNIPFQECDKLTGYTPKPYVEVHSFLDDVRQEIRSNER